MSTTKTIIDKVRITLTQPEMTFNLTSSYAGVSASHLKWLTYVTASAGNTEMTIVIPELKEGGTKLTDVKGNNKKYYVSIPLDPSAQVSTIYANYSGALDKQYNPPEYINKLSFQVYINGLLANDVSPSNPIELELVLYK